MPGDTTPEAVELMQRIWMAKTGQERVEWWSVQTHAANMTRFNRIRERHPEASDAEVTALWMEETYRGRDDIRPEVLAAACEWIRQRTVTESRD